MRRWIAYRVSGSPVRRAMTHKVLTGLFARTSQDRGDSPEAPTGLLYFTGDPTKAGTPTRDS